MGFMGQQYLYKVHFHKSKKAEVAKYTVKLCFWDREEKKAGGEGGEGTQHIGLPSLSPPPPHSPLLYCSGYIEFGSNFITGAVLLTKPNVQHQIFLRQKIKLFLPLSLHLLYGARS